MLKLIEFIKDRYRNYSWSFSNAVVHIMRNGYTFQDAEKIVKQALNQFRNEV